MDERRGDYTYRIRFNLPESVDNIRPGQILPVKHVDDVSVLEVPDVPGDSVFYTKLEIVAMSDMELDDFEVDFATSVLRRGRRSLSIKQRAVITRMWIKYRRSLAQKKNQQSEEIKKEYIRALELEER